MPEFIRPQRAIIETGGGSGLELLVPVVVVALVVVVGGAVVLFVMAHLVLIAAGVGVLGIVAVTMVQFLKRFMVVAHNPPRAAPMAVPGRGYPLPRGLAVTEGRRAIEPPAQHVHFRFHGVSAEDAAIIRRHETPGRPAIEEDPWSPSPS